MRVVSSLSSSSSSSSSSKSEFRSHPLAVVLSVIDRMQDKGGNVCLIRSIHGLVAEATNSSVSRVARQSKWGGSSHH